MCLYSESFSREAKFCRVGLSVMLLLLVSVHSRSVDAAPLSGSGSNGTAVPSAKGSILPSFPSQLMTVVGELGVSKTPVLLPTWLPPSKVKLYADVSGGPYLGGYECRLGTAPHSANYETEFYMQAGKGKVVRHKRKVQLAPQTSGYINDSGNFASIEWLQDGYCYRLGLPNSGKKATIESLVRIARSVRPVPGSIITSSPKGQNRLKEAYREEEEIAESSRLSLLAKKYADAIGDASRKNYKQSEAKLTDVIKGWKKCYELPPLEFVQSFYGLVLQKTGRQAEVAKINTQVGPLLLRREADLKKELQAISSRLLSPKRGSVNALKESQYKVCRQLADLYLAMGRFEDSELQYREAINACAASFGIHSSDAELLAQSYRNLLRLRGKSVDVVEELIQQHEEKQEEE